MVYQCGAHQGAEVLGAEGAEGVGGEVLGEEEEAGAEGLGGGGGEEGGTSNAMRGPPKVW